jgi:hypothetical protein
MVLARATPMTWWLSQPRCACAAPSLGPRVDPDVAAIPAGGQLAPPVGGDRRGGAGRLGTRQDYSAAAIEGKAAAEFAGTRNADEVKQLRAYFDSLVGEGHGQAKGQPGQT